MTENTISFDRFTEQAKHALAAAQREAQRVGQNVLEPEHLLLGIVSLSGSVAVRILQDLNVAPEQLRRAIKALLQPGNQFIGEVQLTPRTKRVIEYAVMETQQLHEQYLSAEHFLLGVLRAESGEACRLLLQQGVTLEAARAAVARVHYAMEIEQLANTAYQPGNQQPYGLAPYPDASVEISSARQQQAVALALSRRKASRIYTYAVLVPLLIAFILLSQGIISLGWLIDMPGVLLMPALSWQPIEGWSPLFSLLLFGLAMVLFLILILPLSWHTGFAIPRRYGLRKDSALSWFASISKAWLIFSIDMCLLVEVATLLIALQPQTWWAWTALFQFLYSLLVTRFRSFWLMGWLNKMTPLPEGEITRQLQNLLTRLKLPPCPIYQVKVSDKTDAANGYFVGFGRGRRIILTDTLIQKFTSDEIEVILAHELGHLVHHDIWMRLVIRGFSFLGGFYVVSLVLNPFAVLPLMLNLFPNLGSFLPWELFHDFALVLGGMLYLFYVSLTMRYRRYQEYQADEFALQTTGKVQAFKDAMTRLTDLAMLVTASTSNAKHPTSHPTLVKRLQHADEFAARHTIPVAPEQAQGRAARRVIR